jgi:hypothetical protein
MTDYINISEHEKEERQRRTFCLLPRTEQESVLWMTTNRVAFGQDVVVEEGWWDKILDKALMIC